MDHLPLPNNPVLVEPDAVRLVCEEAYDGGPFPTYPSRKGQAYMVSLPPRRFGDTLYEFRHPLQARELEPFFQTWLFFGLLHAVLGKLYDPNDFVKEAEEGSSTIKLLSTWKLLPLINLWIRNSADKINDTPFKQNFACCLVMARNVIHAAPADFDANLKYSITSIIEVFGLAANKVFDIWAIDNQPLCMWHASYHETQKEGQMLASGWCPSEISRSKHIFKFLQTLHFLSRMSKLESTNRHGLCSKSRCEAYQNNLQQYRSLHRTVDCPCDDYNMDSQRLIGILENGGLPLLRISSHGSLDELSVEVVESQPGSNYVAISHVWADGLGNTVANALPRCQLSHIASLATAASDCCRLSRGNERGALIWLDTLCCPIKPSSAKQIALAQMKRTYRQAVLVLVLDASLQMYDSQPLGPAEIFARILTSGWMRRLWTLQEASLASVLVFQFRDRAVSFPSAWAALSQSFHGDVGRRGLVWDLLSAGYSLLTHFQPNAGDITYGLDIGILMEASQHRSVSVASDEPLLLGSLLNLDIRTILRSPIDTRMQTMWSLLRPRGIPQNIIFVGPKLTTPGYRWAPATLLIPRNPSSAAIHPSPKEENTGILSPAGLLVRLPGNFVFSPNTLGRLLDGSRYIDDNVWMRDCDNIWYLIASAPESKGEQRKKLLWDVMRENPRGLAVLLASEFTAPPSPYQKDVAPPTRQALLVKFKYTAEEVNHVQSEMQVVVTKFAKSRTLVLDSAYHCAQLLSKETIPDRELLFLDPMTSFRRRIRDHAANFEHHGLRIPRDGDRLRTAAFFEIYIFTMFVGKYWLMGPRISYNQQWCVD